ncbi:unnamed protein product [Owenia fusiformis]|nr:unnamed protein product [Owenia fusiformis]
MTIVENTPSQPSNFKMIRPRKIKNISPLSVLKSVGPKLVPFFKTVAIFFVLFPTSDTSTLFCCVIKILPILSLIVFVLLHGMNLDEVYVYSRRVLLGLIFSMIGDICLVWKANYFLHGIASFAIAQAFYARAFGLLPLKHISGAVCFTVGAITYLYLVPGLEGPMVYFVAMYTALIMFMAWRAIARVQFFEDDWTWNDDLWTWTKLCGCMGALLFMVSDLTIAMDRFRFSVPFAHTFIMMTYYAAQMMISLSVIDSQVDIVLEKSKKL